MKPSPRWLILLSLALAACDLAAPALPTLVPTLSPAPATPTAMRSPTSPAPVEPSATPPPSETPAPPTVPPPTPAAAQFIAYVRDQQLLVTDVTGGRAGGTTQYTLAGVDDQVLSLAWSPSGEFIAFVSLASGEPRLFVVYAVGAGTPVDLGPGLGPAWSPDSTRLVFERDGNLWLTPIDAPAPAQLTFQTDWAWGQAAFTPDGSAVIVAENARANLGASGNTFFTLKRLALDGSGALTPLPGSPELAGVRLPMNLRFAPDGRKLAFSTSYHYNACGAPGAHYIGDANGNNLSELVSPSLAALADPQNEVFLSAYDFAWSPASDAILAAGYVRNCKDFSGDIVGGPQLSVLGLDGTERLIVPGAFSAPSYDRTGNWFAAVRYPGLQSPDGNVQIYSAQTGELVLDLGPGNSPQLQP